MHSTFCFTIIDSGIGLILFGAPIMAIVLTIIVSFIEAEYLNRNSSNFLTMFKAALLANAVSTVVGFVILIFLNMFNVFHAFSALTGITFKSGNGMIGYFGRILLMALFYGITVLVEIPIFKYRLKDSVPDIRTEVIKANLVTYALLLLLFILL